MIWTACQWISICHAQSGISTTHPIVANVKESACNFTTLNVTLHIENMYAGSSFSELVSTYISKLYA